MGQEAIWKHKYLQYNGNTNHLYIYRNGLYLKGMDLRTKAERYKRFIKRNIQYGENKCYQINAYVNDV